MGWKQAPKSCDATNTWSAPPERFQYGICPRTSTTASASRPRACNSSEEPDLHPRPDPASPTVLPALAHYSEVAHEQQLRITSPLTARRRGRTKPPGSASSRHSRGSGPTWRGRPPEMEPGGRKEVAATSPLQKKDLLLAGARAREEAVAARGGGAGRRREYQHCTLRFHKVTGNVF
ncbi:hypothetical protein E2562_013177 [Oryza meyeriana var. granulata]|uniref:Uncharacterized protein n=1 Tax=Oryza meyeriana var. granulata TaxID=110450 RepID=A0A6G1DJ27_9ORYZ|nr:hypothetical protein E2562_013177 [Oryza meyeriana var. granulata]